jgi:hypothetical protein
MKSYFCYCCFRCVYLSVTITSKLFLIRHGITPENFVVDKTNEEYWNSRSDYGY